MTGHALKRVYPTPGLTEPHVKGHRLFHALLRRAREVRDYRHLAGLSDHLLEDIGVTRDQAKTLAAWGFWKRLPRTTREP